MKNLCLSFVIQLLILSFNQFSFSQIRVAPGITSTDQTENISRNELKILQKQNFNLLEIEDLFNPTITSINFDDLVIPTGGGQNAMNISPFRYAGVSFYYPNQTTYLTRFNSYSPSNSLIVGSDFPEIGTIYNVESLFIEFAQPSKDVAFIMGRDSSYNQVYVDVYQANNQLIASIPVSFGANAWYAISLNQYSQTIRKVVLRRIPPISGYSYGHIYLDNFQFTPIITGSPEGYLDGVNLQQAKASGWSRDPDDLGAANFVDCYVGGMAGQGTPIGRVTANISSPDVGMHRFEIAIPTNFRNGNNHQLFCYGIDIAGGNPNTQLGGSPKTFKFNTPIGYLDSVSSLNESNDESDSDGIVSGWSLDADVPLQSNDVHFYIGGPSGTVPLSGLTTANISRPDVNEETNLPGDHGYEFLIPDQYRDGIDHPIYAYGIDLTGDQNKNLIGSPKTFNLKPRVQSVVFESFNDATHGSTVEPGNPGNGIQGSAIGQRIFPDKETGNDNLNRRTVLVKATLAIPRPNTKVYFKNYDLDDPSANSPPVDPTGNAGNDNNETPQAGTFNVIAPCMSDQDGISCLTDASGVATIEFTTTMQPGDNFAVAASTRPSYLNGVEVDGVNLKDTSSNSLPTGSAKRTEMLTVWRRLHIEVDSMGSVANNNVIGTFSSGGIIGTGDQALTVNVATPLEEDRFENGRIVIGSRSFRIINSDPTATPPVKANTADTVFIRNTGGKFTISNGQSFTLYDDDDFNDNDGTILDGDNLPSLSEDVDEPDLKLLTSNDIPCSNVYSTNNCNVFVSAYVRPVFDLAGSYENIPFYSNVSSTSLASIRMSYFQNRIWQARTDFWTIYLLGAYQFESGVDGDPYYQGAITGFKDGPGTNDGEGAVIFNEVSRPNEYDALNILYPDFPDWRTRPVNRRATIAHEVGHLFGGDHEDYSTGTTNAGIMAQTSNRTSPLFTDTTINKIRGGTGLFHP